jgi:Uncharacterized membrane-anchored protein conserved in bacteria
MEGSIRFSLKRDKGEPLGAIIILSHRNRWHVHISYRMDQFVRRGKKFDSDQSGKIQEKSESMNHLSSVDLQNKQNVFSKVPEITALFWITKVLTTGMGEVFSDYLVKQINPVIAVVLGAITFGAAIVLQLLTKRYIAWIYWLVVVMVSIFGTMVADVVHVVLGVPYMISTLFFSAVLTAVLILWYVVEKTLSIHSIYTFHRELFYWAAVLSTFALGTAAGDLTAMSMNLGYFASGILFTVFLALPFLGYKLFGLNAIFAFWFSYIMTRPVGASFSDWLSKSHSLGGIGWGEGPVSLAAAVLIIFLVGYLQWTKADIKNDGEKLSVSRVR